MRVNTLRSFLSFIFVHFFHSIFLNVSPLRELYDMTWSIRYIPIYTVIYRYNPFPHTDYMFLLTIYRFTLFPLLLFSPSLSNSYGCCCCCYYCRCCTCRCFWCYILVVLAVVVLRRRHPIKFLHLSTKVLLTPPDEGPRVKGQRIKLQDIVDGVYVPQRANGSWIDGEHQIHFVNSLPTSSSLSVSLITD